MSPVSIAATLIVRDEQENIGPCLESLLGFIDEIVVVDTGSRDATIEIVRSFDTKLVCVDWRDDFAWARNLALSHASSDWIFYIDADERAELTGELKPALAIPDAIAARMKFSASAALTPYVEHRLFRNRPDIRFRGGIHETVMPDINRLVAGGKGKIVDAPLHVVHLGYEGDLTHKHRRNLPLLQRAVKQDPERIYLWHTLGEAYFGLGRVEEARSAWQSGLEKIRGVETRDDHVLIFADLLALELCNPGRLSTATIDLMNEARKLHPDDPLVLWYAAQVLLRQGKAKQARQIGEQLAAVEVQNIPVGHLAYDKHLFGSLANGMIGMSWIEEGDYQKAADALRVAEAQDPSNLEISTKRSWAESRMSKSRPI